MQIACPQCSMEYALDPRLLPPGGAPVQCTRCGHVFIAAPPSQPAPVSNETLSFGRRAPAGGATGPKRTQEFGSATDTAMTQPMVIPGLLPQPATRGPAPGLVPPSAATTQAFGVPLDPSATQPMAVPLPMPQPTHQGGAPVANNTLTFGVSSTARTQAPAVPPGMSPAPPSSPQQSAADREMSSWLFDDVDEPDSTQQLSADSIPLPAPAALDKAPPPATGSHRVAAPAQGGVALGATPPPGTGSHRVPAQGGARTATQPNMPAPQAGVPLDAAPPPGTGSHRMPAPAQGGVALGATPPPGTGSHRVPAQGGARTATHPNMPAPQAGVPLDAAPPPGTGSYRMPTAVPATAQPEPMPIQAGLYKVSVPSTEVLPPDMVPMPSSPALAAPPVQMEGEEPPSDLRVLSQSEAEQLQLGASPAPTTGVHRMPGTPPGAVPLGDSPPTNTGLRRIELPPEELLAATQPSTSRPPRKPAAQEPPSRWPMIGAALAGVALVLLVLWGGVIRPALTKDANALSPESVALLEEATGLIRKDDISSREDALARLRKLSELYPDNVQIQAEMAVAVALNLDDVRVMADGMREALKVLERESNALREAQSPADWQSRVNAMQEEMNSVRSDLQPLEAQIAIQGDQVVIMLRKLEQARPEEPPADAQARLLGRALLSAVSGSADAISMAESLQKADQRAWGSVVLAEYVLNASSSSIPLEEAAADLERVREQDKAFLRPHVLGARLALRRGQPTVAQTLLDNAVALNPRHMLARRLHDRATTMAREIEEYRENFQP